MIGEIQMDVELLYAHGLKDLLSPVRHVAGIRFRLELQLDGPDVLLRAERPKVGLLMIKKLLINPSSDLKVEFELSYLNGTDSFESGKLLVALREAPVQLFGLPLHEDGERVPDEADDAQGDHDGDEHGADGIGDHPAEELHEDGRDDDAHAAQRVRQDVKEDAVHDDGAAGRLVTSVGMAVSAGMGMAVARPVVTVPVSPATVRVAVMAVPVVEVVQVPCVRIAYLDAQRLLFFMSRMGMIVAATSSVAVPVMECKNA